MSTKTMYASGLIMDFICPQCETTPCPYKSWNEKNGCAKLIRYNEQLGRCCATCIHLVDAKFCGELARKKKSQSRYVDFSEFLIDDIVTHSCDAWTNDYDE